MLENKENPLNKQGNPGIIFAKGTGKYDKPSKPSIKRNEAKRKFEDMQHQKEFERLWANL